MSVSTNPILPPVPGADVQYDNQPRSGLVNDHKIHFRQIMPNSTGISSELWLQMSGAWEKTNFDFSNTLLEYSGALSRLSEQQDMVLYWKDSYCRLYNDHKVLEKRFEDASGTIIQMNMNMAERDEISRERAEIITFLQAKVDELQLQLTSERLTSFARYGELPSPSEAGSTDWSASSSVSIIEEGLKEA